MEPIIHSNEEIFQNLLVLAENGEAEPSNVYQLGLCYLKALGTEKDLSKAVKWMKASKLNDPTAKLALLNAKFELGEEFFLKKDEKSLESAIKIWKSAAKCNHGKSNYALGCCHFKGTGLEKDMELAVTYWNMAAFKDHPQAQYSLGDFYYEGKNGQKDLKKALFYYTKALENGLKTHYQLGMCYYNGDKTIIDVKKSIHHFTEAAKEGSILANFQLGVCYYKDEGIPRDYKKAIHFLTIAANQGIVEAQLVLGMFYAVDREGFPKNIDRSIHWLSIAAESGSADAQYELGCKYYRGVDLPQNKEGAREYLQLAAKAGHTGAISYIIKFNI